MTFCLTIAGFDPSAGAGVLADLETFRRLGADGAAIITAITAQNPSRVMAVHPVSPSWVREQAEALFEFRFPAAIKVGMLGSASVVREVARLLDRLEGVWVVLDPVIRASTGTELLTPSGLKLLVDRLLPRSSVITPNLAEAERLLGVGVRGEKGMVQAARDLLRLGPRAVVITGGDRRGDPLDVLFDQRGPMILAGRRIPAGRVRGTGCRYSAALATYLARGWSMRRAVRGARSFVRRHLRSKLRRG